MASRTPPKNAPRTRGIIAYTESGKRVVLAGPPKPVPVGKGKYVNPQWDYQSRPVPDKPKGAPRKTTPAPPKRTTPPRRIPARPRIATAGIPGAPAAFSPEQWAFSKPGKRAIREELRANKIAVARFAGDLPVPWRDAMEQIGARKAIERTIRSNYYDTPQAYLGRTISGFGTTAKTIITGMPAASVKGVYIAGKALQALGVVPSGRGVSGQIDAGKEVVNEAVVRPAVDYYWPLAKQFATDPAGTFEKRGLEGILAAAALWSGAGQGAALVGRASAQTGRLSRATRQAGSVRGGLRVYGAERKALTAQQIRDIQLRDQRAVASAGRSVEAPMLYRKADEVIGTARRAAEITGNATANASERVLARLGDFGSRSVLPGSRRYREPFQRQQTEDIPGGPRQIIEVPRRPRSSNPLSRGFQRVVTEPVGGALRRRTDSLISERLGLAGYLSGFAVAASRGGRDMADEIKTGTDAGVYNEAQGLAKLISQLKGAGRTGALPSSEVGRGTTAAIIRAMGVTESKGGSRTWGRDELIARGNAWLEDPKKGGAVKSNRKKRALIEQIETLKSIPDEWLDPTTSPRWLNDLEGEVRKVLRKSTSIKLDVGAITPDSAKWGGARAQAQLGFNGRPLATVIADTYRGPRADQTRAARIGEELRSRRNSGRSRYENLEGYSTEALMTLQANLTRRAATIRGRTKGFVAEARRDAMGAFDEDSRLQSAADDARARVRELEARPDTSEIRQQLKDARAELSRTVQFLRQRAAARKRMADQGARAMSLAAAGRERRAAGVDRADLEFDVERAAARVQMARQGRAAMNRAQAARARRATTAGRRRQKRVTPIIPVPATTIFAAGRRKGRADRRSGTARFGTMLRADMRLYVANQNAKRKKAEASARQADNETIRREEIEPGLRAQGEARGERRVLTQSEVRARRELDAARAELRKFNEDQQRARRTSKTPAQRKADRDLAQARTSTREGIPAGAKDVYDRVKELQAALAAARASRNGTRGQIAEARRRLEQARRNLSKARARYARFAYVGAQGPRAEGMAPGEYFPQQSPIRGDADTRFNTTVRGAFGDSGNNEFAASAGASLSPRQEKFNAAVLADDGLILLSPRVVIDALRSALDAKIRAEVASAFVTKYAYRGQNDRVISGDAARDFVSRSNGIYTLISTKELARISSLSGDSIGGMELRRLIDQMPGAAGNEMVAIPTAAIRGWKTALAPAGNQFGRTIDYIQSLWKGGILALNPRWYIQNFFGMWGQFALGAGADLQAISMARNPKYLEAIPGRISQMGLSQEFGEYARRAQGDATNWLGSLIRAGYFANSRLESVPRRAMYWHAAKKGLANSQLMRNGVMDEGVLAAAWLDVARAAGRNDRGANAIVDQALLETERFMGNYSTYNLLERSVLKRMFPFYAWMRAINRLAFALPAKHPKRAALLSAASMMAYDERNDASGYNKGIWFRNYQIVMNAAFPLFSTLPTFEAMTSIGDSVEQGGPAALVNIPVQAGKALLEQSGPPWSEVAAFMTGRSLAGEPLTFPEGYEGFRTQPGTGTMVRTNPTTGEREYGPPTVSAYRRLEGLLPYANLARTILAGSMTPYSSTSALDLVRYRGDQGIGRDTDYQRSQLFRPARDNQTRSRPWWGTALQFIPGTAVDLYDPKALARRQAEMNKQYIASLRFAANDQKKPRTR